jgi:hypothetical protein
MMIGDESGDDCSAKVEWWRFVQAREKSSPRECLGREVAGEPKDVKVSSWGDRGTRLALLGAAMDIVRGGICSERPRERKSGLLGVCGETSGTALSSFDTPLTPWSTSRKFGDGASCVVAASDIDLFFGGV